MPLSLFVHVLPLNLDSFMCGSYPVSLWNVGGSTHVPAHARNNAWRWSTSTSESWKSEHIIFTVSLQLNTKENNKLFNIMLIILSVYTIVSMIQLYNGNISTSLGSNYLYLKQICMGPSSLSEQS